MNTIIITADDLAYSPEVTAGICKAGCYGIVTETSVLIHSPWASESIAQAKAVGLSIGLHLDLVSPFVAARSPRFGPTTPFCSELLRREYDHRVERLFSGEELIAIRDEMRRQVESFAQIAGHLPSHLDYHYGLHYVGEFMALYLIVAEQYGLPVRWGRQYAGANPYKLAPACLCDSFRGLPRGGLELFLQAVDQPCEGVKEIICHPGYTTPDPVPDSYNCERELELGTLVDPRLKEELARRQVQCVTYSWLQRGVFDDATPTPDPKKGYWNE